MLSLAPQHPGQPLALVREQVEAGLEAVGVGLLVGLVGPALVGLFDVLDPAADGRDHLVPAGVVHPTSVQGVGHRSWKKDNDITSKCSKSFHKMLEFRLEFPKIA